MPFTMGLSVISGNGVAVRLRAAFCMVIVPPDGALLASTRSAWAGRRRVTGRAGEHDRLVKRGQGRSSTNWGRPAGCLWRTAAGS
jgi:hypothetical protein